MDSDVNGFLYYKLPLIPQNSQPFILWVLFFPFIDCSSESEKSEDQITQLKHLKRVRIQRFNQAIFILPAV